MKFFKALLVFIFIAALVMMGALTYLWVKRVPLLEKAANQAANELFQGSLRLRDVTLTKDWHLMIQGVSGTMQTDFKPVNLEVEKLETQESLLQILRTQRSEMVFQGFRPVPSQSHPISGLIKIRFGNYSSVKVTAQLDHVLLQDYAWLNPPAFEGLGGTVSGDFLVRIDSKENAKFNLNLKADEKGGEVPARFLNFALPYLPAASQNSKELKKLLTNEKSAHFSMGIVQAGIVEPGKIQALIKMVFPEQNLNLNLNLTIKVDEKHAFFRAFKLMGIFKASASQ